MPTNKQDIINVTNPNGDACSMTLGALLTAVLGSDDAAKPTDTALRKAVQTYCNGNGACETSVYDELRDWYSQ